MRRERHHRHDYPHRDDGLPAPSPQASNAGDSWRTEPSPMLHEIDDVGEEDAETFVHVPKGGGQ